MTTPEPQPGRPEAPAPDGFAPVDYPAVDYPGVDHPGDATQVAPPAYNTPPYPQPSPFSPSPYPQQAPFSASPYPQPGGTSYPPGYPPEPMPSPYYGYDPYRSPGVPMGTNGKAIASLVCSLLGFFCGITAIIGVVLGFLGMSETKRTGQEGHGLALAGTIVGGVWIGMWVLYLLWAAAMAASFGTSGAWT